MPSNSTVNFFLNSSPVKKYFLYHIFDIDTLGEILIEMTTLQNIL